MVPCTSKTDISLRRHLNRQTDPSHCSPNPQGISATAGESPRGRNPAPARTHRLRTAPPEDAAAPPQLLHSVGNVCGLRVIPGEPPPEREKLSPARPRPLLPPKPISLQLRSHPTRSEKQMTHNLTEHSGAEPICRRRLPHALWELSRYYIQPRRDLRNSLQVAARASPLGNRRSRETGCMPLKRRKAGLRENDWEFFGEREEALVL